ncbi:MAG TPA: DUF4215 domain-containing protein [Polyangiaceae bacterium]
MSWSSFRLFGVMGVWLAAQTGCGGNPEVSGVDPGGQNGGTDSGGTGSSQAGKAGSLNLPTGGTEGNGEGGSGAMGQSDYVCGNQELEPGEFCDDGNTDDDDGCSADCTEVDLDFDCSEIGEPCVQVVICGSGVLEGDEVCDDGNTDDGDGCSADCATVEDGFVCVRPGKECVAVSVCGNGARERGEQCDDGNADAADGCDAACQLESGFFCSTPGTDCVELVCGDGVRTPDEACDDGTSLPDDGCDDTCEVRQGWRCNTAGCQPICGDGRVEKGELCDDGARVSGDGCSSGCTVEPYFGCTTPAHQTSVCTSTIACGNGTLDPGEVCDPPGTNGCKAGCKSFTPTTIPAVCGNGTVEEGEGCEPKSIPGCSATCQVTAGWTCPQPGFCFENPRCGDGNVDLSLGEQCENPPIPGVPHAGCGANCKALTGYTCVGLTAADTTCFRPVCGDGVIQPGEQCDDGANGAGCVSCVLTAGWACPTPGAACIARCGDGIKVGAEECDDSNNNNGDGCNRGCFVEPGFKCPPVGACTAAICGDKVVDKGERCDDGGVCVNATNKGVACTSVTTCVDPDGGAGPIVPSCQPVAGDGCGATCQKEPTITPGPNPTVVTSCGDGMINADTGEECDDGNIDEDDGCTSTCQLDDRFTCTLINSRPTSIQMKVTYRDFKARNVVGGGGHPDFQWQPNPEQLGMPGPVCTRDANAACNTAAGVVCGANQCARLDTEGKPVYHRTNNEGRITSHQSYALWYRDTNAANLAGTNGVIQQTAIPSTLTLNQQGGAASDVYQYSSTSHFPLDTAAGAFGLVCAELNPDPACCAAGGACEGHNFHFTSELRYFFQYNGGETLTFYGDDDVWVFINGRLAVDLGGVHGQQYGRVVLGDDGRVGAADSGGDSGCSVHNQDNLAPLNGCLTAAELADDTDTRFGLTRGRTYEIVLFHAERHTTASNFQLTLNGFLPQRSSCTPICGDGEVVPGEVCDQGTGAGGNQDGVSGRCNTSCNAYAFCGDGTRQTGEACDDGSNITLYRTAATPVGACAPGCKLPASCGDGTTQAGQNEKCDKGTSMNTGAYGGCTATCQLGGYCGDGAKNGTEFCDRGVLNGKEYGPTSCGFDCKLGPHCGDAIPNGTEECDLGSAENGTAGAACDATCKKVPGCGDGLKQANESCDYGQFYSNAYGGCTNMCEFGPRCGDGTAQTPYEECDDGALANTGGYDGCNATCDLGPHCGDAVIQTDHQEACDNGFNNDDYKFDDESCGIGCTPPPSCGDGSVQASFELCDNGDANDDDAYEGCTTKCEFGPYCGDGEADGPELCDLGDENVSYAAAAGGCSYDCEPAPYCGDATRNGPEQCDLGTDANTGDYGTCNADCTFAPRCGDGEKQDGEQCDDGPGGSLSCTAACRRRQVVQ